MSAGTPESMYPQWADEPDLVPGAPSAMPSFFINTPRVVSWAIQLLPTMKRPNNLQTKSRAPVVAVTGPNQLNPTPLRGTSAPPAANYDALGALTAPSFLSGSAMGATACQTR